MKITLTTPGGQKVDAEKVEVVGTEYASGCGEVTKVLLDGRPGEVQETPPRIAALLKAATEHKPVTPKPGSCERGGCDARAEFVITSETNAGVETSRVCTAHVGEMLAPVVTQTVSRILGE